MTKPDSFSRLTEASIAEALSELPQSGRVFDLGSGWWHGMPVVPAHPHFNVLTYRSPRGGRADQDLDYLDPEKNTVNLTFTSEVVSGTVHTGTHIDALCHVSCGQPDVWFGGVPVDENLGDFGARQLDASQLPPVISRGILLDVPGAYGWEHCPAGYRIGREELVRTAEAQGTEPRAGDAVLVRTGEMMFWPDSEAMAAVHGAGVSIDGAEWLVEQAPLLVGDDTANFECIPSGVDGDPFPAHRLLVQEHGIPIMEWVNSEGLAKEEVYVFMFVCLPLNISGATGSMARPIAIT